MAEFLPQKLGQNYVDYIMKQYQTWIDAIFGEENDNSQASAIDPAVFSGVTGVQFWGSYYGGNNYTRYGMFGVDISANNDGNVIKSYMPIRGSNQGEEDYSKFNNWFSDSYIFCDMWGSYELSHVINNKRYFRSLELDSSEINANYSVTFLDGVSSPFYSEAPSVSTGVTASFDSNTGNAVNFPVWSRPSSDGILTLGAPVQQYNSFTNAPYIYNVPSGSDGYNSTTYVTNEGDTITVTFNDYGVNTGTYGYNISYDDLYSIFSDLVIPSLGLQDTVIVPTYTDIKYEDQGQFYIEPLHQYDKLPTAPQIDETIDFAEYPAILAETSTAFFNMLPVTLSALLAGTLVLAVLIRNIGR